MKSSVSVLLLAAITTITTIMPSTAISVPDDEAAQSSSGSATIWWNTEGGKVIQFKDRPKPYCLMLLYNTDGSFVFGWQRDLPAHVTVEKAGWVYAENEVVPAALRIGNEWSEQGDGKTLNLEAISWSNSLTLLVDDQADDRLLRKGEVTIKLENAEFSVQLPRRKIEQLVASAKQCKQAIHYP